MSSEARRWRPSTNAKHGLWFLAGFLIAFYVSEKDKRHQEKDYGKKWARAYAAKYCSRAQDQALRLQFESTHGTHVLECINTNSHEECRLSSEASRQERQ